MNSTSTTNLFQSFRAGILPVADRVLTLAGKSGASRDEILGRFRRDPLAQSAFTVLVVGEAKRGKTSFVNAILGQDLLPTDVEVATCQVFCVSPLKLEEAADPPGHERFRLVFEDESVREIGRQDLARYGSQIEMDEHGAPVLDRTVRWIEAEVQAAFLPEEIRLLDTPGVGALFAAHAQITWRFLPHADAVIFVLDSTAPLSRQEMELLVEIRRSTENVFFVQTKIDLFPKEEWKAVLARNTEILEKQLGRPRGVRVWPVACRHLMTAARSGDSDYLAASRYDDLKQALQSFLFQSAGRGRCANVLLQLNRTAQEAERRLTAEAAALSHESAAGAANLRRQIASFQAEFESSWGENGRERRRLLAERAKSVEIARRRFRDALSPGGSVEQSWLKRIGDLASLGEARQLAASLETDVSLEAGQLWLRTRQAALRDALSLLESAQMELDFLGAPAEPAPRPESNGAAFQVRDGWWDYLQAMRGEYATGMMLSSLLGLGSTVVPVLGLLALPMSAACVIAGLASAPKTLLERAKAQLREHLAQVLQRCRQFFHQVATDAQRLSVTDDFFDELSDAFHRRLMQAVDEKRQSLATRMRDLADAAALSERDRKVRQGAVAELLKEWKAVSDQLKRSAMMLQPARSLSGPPAQPAAVGTTSGGQCVDPRVGV
jgi:signal recognition particle receptor subunit beta